MTTIPRKYRLLPMQIGLAVGVLVLYFFWFRTGKVNVESQWGAIREQELKKYDGIREVSLEFIRKYSAVDYKIHDLTEDQINGMNDTQLMVVAHSFLDNADVICGRRIRMGSLSVGGWEICDDDFIRPKKPPCLVYAFGSIEKFAFEDDIARVYKCEVHAFKSDFEGRDYNRSKSIHVHPYSVGKYTEITPEGRELYTLSDIKTILGHTKRNIDVIQLDIENGEWASLYNMIDEEELTNVKQVLVEYHMGASPSEDRLRRMLRILRDMNDLGFRKFYAHKSPKGSFHHPNFPVVRAKNYEIHYLNTNFLKKKGKKSDEGGDEDEEEGDNDL